MVPPLAGRAHARIGEWGLGVGEWRVVIRVFVIGYWGVVPAVAAPTGVRGRNASPHGRDTLSRAYARIGD